MHTPWSHQQPYLTLVADDPDKARQLTRMLLAHGAPTVRWLDGSDHTPTELRGLLELSKGQPPDLFIVDLMRLPEATAAMIRSIRLQLGATIMPIAVLVPFRERQLQESQFTAGADAVFERLGDDTDYRREAARLVTYWVRTRRLDAVGA